MVSMTLALAVMVGLVLVPVAQATKFYDSNFGTTAATSSGMPPSPSGSAFGGFFGTTNGGIGEMVVNDPTITTDGGGHSGWVYVLDRGANRVQAFDQDKNFQWAIGRDVVAPSVNEAQVLAVKATAGQFRLEFNGQTTGDLAWNVPASGGSGPTASVQNALRALSSVGAPGNSNVTVTGTVSTASVPNGRYAIAFVSGLAAANQNQVTVQPGTTALTGSASVSTIANGSATPGAGDTSERQTLTVGGGASGGDHSVSFGATAPTSATVPFGASAAAVDAQLETIGGIGAGGVNVTGPDGGPYTVEFTGPRASIDQPQLTTNPAGLTPTGTASVATTQDGASFEKCTTAGQCKTGLATPAANAALGNAGTFNIANGITIDQATGHLFIREVGTNARVQQFTGSGEFVRAFGWDVTASGPGNVGGFETCNLTTGDICKAGVTGDALGQLGQNSVTTVNGTNNGIVSAPPGSPTAGDLYVADPGPNTSVANRRVLQFDIPAAAAGSVTPVSAISSLTPGGASVFGTLDTEPGRLAIGADGVLYATAGSSGSARGIARYDTATDTFLPSIDTQDVPQLPAAFSIPVLEVNAQTGHLLVAVNTGQSIVELDVTGKPETVGPEHVVDRHGLGLAATFNGVATDSGTGRYYASTSGGPASTGVGQRVLVLDDTGIDPPPTVDLLPPTDVGATTANLQARINPNGPTGFATNYRFQVSTTGLDDDWHDVAADQLVGANGDGGTPVLVDDAISGLEANTFYRVRIITTRNPAAGTAVSAELTFVTDPKEPKAETVTAQQISDTTAQLVGRLNPNGLATSYWFEWGDDNYGKRVPVPSGSATGSTDRVVGEALSGLDPGSVYHFRFCAQNALGTVCGADQQFETRPAVEPADGARAYEMVTAPDKPLRRGSESTGGAQAPDYARLQGGLPAPDGDAAMWTMFAGATDPEAGHAFTAVETYEVRRRTGAGWRGDAVVNTPPVSGGANAQSDFLGVSADLNTQQWAMRTPMFESLTQGSTRIMGDTGGPRGAGWYPWLDPAWLPPGTVGDGNYTAGAAAPVITDDGAALIGGFDTNGPNGRDVTGTGDALAPKDLSPPQTAGGALFRSGWPDWSPQDLLNECTGSVGDSPTLIPMRDSNEVDPGPPGSFTVQLVSYGVGATTITALSEAFGFPAGVVADHYVSGPGIVDGTRVVSRDSALQITIDTPTQAAGSFATITVGQNTALFDEHLIKTQPCGEGSPTSTRGAAIQGTGRLGGTRMTTMSDSGDRVFFLSPDPGVLKEDFTTLDACGVGSEDQTWCPPQLFVRQYDDQGDATVRWLSRAEDELSQGPGDGGSGPQFIGAFGNGAAFEGASRDGSVVYFRTNAPLLADDPNGQEDVLREASPKSWDLYRYNLGPDNNADPGAGDPGNRLTRISGGPDGDADPNTNCSSAASDCGGAANGVGGAVRFMSDDGDRVYFVTAAQIPGAENTPPKGAAATMAPTAVDSQANNTSRNLYLYDASKPETEAYEFVARMSAGGGDICAVSQVLTFATPHAVSPGSALLGSSDSNCVHGTTSGDAVVFESASQLTADDVDDAIDIYLYDAAEDSLTRITAPPADVVPYRCIEDRSCNGDMGLTGGRTQGAAPLGGLFGSAGPRHWNIAQDAEGRLKAVYFESRLPLADGATHSDAMKVYEWRDGRLSLISPGDTLNSAFYSGNSRDGRSVFFWSEQRISGWEIDEADGDLYVARVGGGFPDPPAAPAVCGVLAGGCQGGGSQAVGGDPQTKAPGGSNADPGARATLTVAGLSAKARRAAARRGRLALSVRSGSAGTVRAVARGRVGKRLRRLAVGSVRLRKPGSVVVRLRLDSAARRSLAGGRALRLSVRVTVAGARPRSMSILLPGVKR